ncbi:EpsG family protein [Liquorilactobacillus sicerae]|uniref:EpsG family protein n=1 Tax=Liquorilactobacillus sicerae TaxID=1416943 RepID=UPI0024805E6F|nr:EpsG family protein [Liquorilactobacillus sicerae]
MFAIMLFFIIIGFLLKKPKIIFFVDTIFLSILTSSSTNVPDFLSYYSIYYNIKKDFYYETGSGWYYLCLMGRSLGIGYAQFKGILVFISLVLIYVTLLYFYKKDNNFIWSLYLLYPALIDCIQIRFFIAAAIGIFAIIFLSKDNLKGYLMFIVLIAFAGTIHSSVLFFILLLFVNIVDKLSKSKLFIIILVVVSATIYFSTIGEKILESAISIFANMRQQSYLVSNNNMSTIEFMVYFIIIISFVLFSMYMKLNFFKLNPNMYSKKLDRLFSIIFFFNIMTLLLLPMLKFSSDFIRIQRPVWILMYSEILFYIANSTKKIFLKRISLVAFAIISFFLLLGYYAPLVLPGFFNF